MNFEILFRKVRIVNTVFTKSTTHSSLPLNVSNKSSSAFKSFTLLNEKTRLWNSWKNLFACNYRFAVPILSLNVRGFSTLPTATNTTTSKDQIKEITNTNNQRTKVPPIPAPRCKNIYLFFFFLICKLNFDYYRWNERGIVFRENRETLQRARGQIFELGRADDDENKRNESERNFSIAEKVDTPLGREVQTWNRTFLDPLQEYRQKEQAIKERSQC